MSNAAVVCKSHVPNGAQTNVDLYNVKSTAGPIVSGLSYL